MKDKKRNWIRFRRPYNNPFYHKHKYDPFYDEHSDYNTNAKSYYDYLARYNRFMRLVADLINRLLRRDIKVKDTPSINFIKKGDWLEDDCDNYDDEIELSAHVVISKLEEVRKLLSTKKKEFTIKNGSKIKNDGVWSPDYIDMINALDKEIVDLQNRVTNNEGDISNIKNDIKNIYKEINNINGRLDSLLGINSKRLVKGRDYNIRFKNGFYTPDKDLIVRAIETENTLDIIIREQTASPLKHDNIINTRMRHSDSVDNVPLSHIFEIELLGEYAKYNNKEILRQTPSGNNVFNIRPTSLRASWGTHLSVVRKTTGYLFAWTSYADGYNTQLSVYNDSNMYLSYGNISMTFTIKK